MPDQVGGDHYGNSEFKHWDWVTAIRLGYLGGYATKYLPRHHLKGGAEDIQKSISCLEKMIEVDSENWATIPCIAIGVGEVNKHTRRFLHENPMDTSLADVCTLVALATDRDDIAEAIEILRLFKERRYGGDDHIDNTGMDHPFGFDQEKESP